MYPELSESERFPLLTPEGRRFLHAMRQHPAAPRWNWPNGEQLDEAGLAEVQRFARRLNNEVPSAPDQPPGWLAEYVEFCLSEVPFYRNRARSGSAFTELPTCARSDLAPRVWEFVPDRQSLDRLIVFSSSGTTGHPASIPSHPATAACGIPLLEHLVNRFGLRFPRGVDHVALSNIVAYRGAYTTALVLAYLAEAGCVRVNLCDEDWRCPDDCAAFLNHWRADVMLGDPLALAQLARVPLRDPPRVMISSIMTLSDGLAAELTGRYGARMLDLYALTEAGIVACRTERGHEVVPPDLYVEVLDESDQPCPAGVRGEITLTGGRNPFLPLLRFRTGDFASRHPDRDRTVLVDLEGRQPVLFVAPDGRWIHSMELARALRPFPLVQFQLHQSAERQFQLRYQGSVGPDALLAALRGVIGPRADIDIGELPPDAVPTRKRIPFRSDASAASRLQVLRRADSIHP
ncbi:MAG: AMP-binding protein [Pirellulaceae bacterium]